jgi:hypothetical protein
MTQPWPLIAKKYEAFECERSRRAIRALGGLARRIDGSPLAQGLFGWTSMLDLLIGLGGPGNRHGSSSAAILWKSADAPAPPKMGGSNH